LLRRLSALADWLFMPKKVLATTAVAHGGLGGSLLGPLGSPVNAVLVEMRTTRGVPSKPWRGTTAIRTDPASRRP